MRDFIDVFRGFTTANYTIEHNFVPYDLQNPSNFPQDSNFANTRSNRSDPVANETLGHVPHNSAKSMINRYGAAEI